MSGPSGESASLWCRGAEDEDSSCAPFTETVLLSEQDELMTPSPVLSCPVLKSLLHWSPTLDDPSLWLS